MVPRVMTNWSAYWRTLPVAKMLTQLSLVVSERYTTVPPTLAGQLQTLNVTEPTYPSLKQCLLGCNNIDGCINAKDPRFGVTLGDGLAVERPNLLRAAAATIDAAKEYGAACLYLPAGTYNLGDLSDFETVFGFSGVSGISVVSPDALFVCRTATRSQPNIFLFEDCERIYCEGLRLRDDGTDLGVDWRGAHFFTFQTNAISGTFRGFTARRCRSEKCVTFFLSTGLRGGRVSDILLEDCSTKNTFYGINCADNGDNLNAPGFKVANAVRAYFPYGVSHHSVDLIIEHDGIARGANSCILIKRYRNDTRDIRVRASFAGSVRNYSHAVKMEHQPMGDSGLIEDIDLDIHVDSNIDGGAAMVPIGFSSYTSTGVEQLGPVSNRWNRIKVAGSFAHVGGLQAFEFRAWPETEGLLTLDPSVGTGSSDSGNPVFPGFVVRVAPDREFRTASGNLTTQTITLPVGQLDSVAFAIVARVYVQDSRLPIRMHNSTVREDIIMGLTGAHGTPVTILKVENIFFVAQGRAAAITYVPAGSNIEVTIAGGEFSTEAFARVEVEFIGGSPASLF